MEACYMIRFIQCDDGLAILRWENLEDAVELKKFIDNCGVTLHYVNMSNPLKPGVEDVE